MQKQDLLGSRDIQNHIFAYKTNGILRIAFHFFIFFIFSSLWERSGMVKPTPPPPGNEKNEKDEK